MPLAETAYDSYPRQVLCWDECLVCGRVQNRFWVNTEFEFHKQKAEELGTACDRCHGRLISCHEPNKLFSINPQVLDDYSVLED